MIDSQIEDAFAGIENVQEDAVLDTIDARDLVALNFPGSPFVVDHLFPESSLALWTGESGSGKTALALHAAVAIALGRPVGGRFITRGAGGPVLYVNGEMSPALLKASVRAAGAGLDANVEDIPPGALVFEGSDGMATIRFQADRTDVEQRARFEATVRSLRPKLIVLDTQRALFSLDEREAMQVRDEFSWLRRIASEYGCCILVLHHLRKQNAVSNSARDRVSGSGDLVASVDVHVQAKSAGGGVLRAIYFDKTRFPRGAYRAGVECTVETKFDPPSDEGDAGRSSFAIGAPEGESADVAGESRIQHDLLARLEAEGPLTRNQLGAGVSGSTKKAFYALVNRRRIVKVGKVERAALWHVRPAASLFGVVHTDEDHSGPFDEDRAENPVRPGLEAVPVVEDRFGPQGVPRQTERRPGAPSASGDPARSPQDERSGPTGPNPLGRTASARTGSRSTHEMACAACNRFAIVRLGDSLCDECAATAGP